MKLSDLIFPRRCKLCADVIDEGAVCAVCSRKLSALVNVRTGTVYADTQRIECRYVFDYENYMVKKLLFALKRNGNCDLYKFAAALYYAAVPEDFCGAVTVVPRRKTNVRYYGYDHVKEPCRIMCRDKGIEFVNLVARRGFSVDQKKLDTYGRMKNAEGKYRIIKKDIPENILLIDDVVTTASTVKSVIREIRKIKADVKITVLCLASQSSSSGNGKLEY